MNVLSKLVYFLYVCIGVVYNSFVVFVVVFKIVINSAYWHINTAPCCKLTRQTLINACFYAYHVGFFGVNIH